MGKSSWSTAAGGHSSEFNRQQTGTPAVIRVPGQAPRVITGITSHLDIPATLLPLLGVKNPPRDYSQGGNLLAPDFHRAYAVAADWNRIAYLGADYKITLPHQLDGGAAQRGDRWRGCPPSGTRGSPNRPSSRRCGKSW
jgi:membrane-anchored protein YejM (alkaline phosphatase superfamily)